MDFIRARSDEQKDVRLNQIKDVAKKQFYSLSYDKITIKSISLELDFARSNLYKYFSTKEEIFATILIDEVAEWIQELKEASPDNAIATSEIETFCQYWTDITCKHLGMIGLYARLTPLYAQNIPHESLTKIRQNFLIHYHELNSLLHLLFPSLTLKQVQHFCQYQFSFIAGFSPAIRDNEAKEEMANQCNKKLSLPDFKVSFQEFLKTLLVGIFNT
ncbi:TetR family transcriptional regulator [Anaerocolumna sp. MB42-C2]|uniref:TetR family transcriptional regulator n=1 Tax=Anaerocolumna sp. MB42-C2 TaxID=3070997 RepID=UPI0027E10BA3|nr:TetR family transcriptional regulator [Anaerocolumna sp. MB42-C2]WMJ88201.1 TetR family transcriptional regulator [Anaerocolumna sp. MB42-C2]